MFKNISKLFAISTLTVLIAACGGGGSDLEESQQPKAQVEISPEAMAVLPKNEDYYVVSSDSSVPVESDGMTDAITDESPKRRTIIY